MYGLSYVQPCMVNHRCEKRSSWAQLDDHRIPSHLRLLSTDPLFLRHLRFLYFWGLSESYINIRYQYLCRVFRNQTFSVVFSKFDDDVSMVFFLMVLFEMYF